MERFIYLIINLSMCIKENRELRKANKDRIKEHYKYLVDKRKDVELSHISIEQLEEIRKNTIEKEQSDQVFLFKTYTILIICLVVLFLLGLLCYKLFF